MDMKEKLHNIVKNAECLYSFDELNEALDRLAREITRDLEDTNPLILSVMTGAIIPMAYLLTRLHFPLEIDYIHATCYCGKTSGGELHWLAEPRKDLKDRTILVFDDIMDGGLTLQAILDYCKEKGAKEVKTAVMVDKVRTREPGVTFEPDYVGVKTEDKYLFGFGLDYEEYLRNVPGIYAVNEES